MPEEWMLGYPSVFVSRKYRGDREYADSFRGEANRLLYDLKNYMRIHKLGQFKMTRVFPDGTVIIALSHFGFDLVLIDVSRGKKPTEAYCTITFLDLPDKIQPMRYPGEIHSGEVEGIDYIKTYYYADLSRCEQCGNVEWTFSFQFQSDDTDYYDSKPENHCVLSQDQGCHGESIGDPGSDENGTYIIWKAYTESSGYNRSGLGYLKISAQAKIPGVLKPVCNISAIICVDCCERSGLEQPDIYWECWEGIDCVDPIVYEGVQIVPVPDSIVISELYDYAESESQGRLYAIPEVGGCPVYDWDKTGPGTLELLDAELGRLSMYERPEELDCFDEITIHVTDRCGGEDQFIGISLCEADHTPLSMGYTLLQMSCNGSQTLTANGGIGPFEWSLSGGGTLTDNEDGTAEYHAPATNPSCSLNPTITVTDCCGDSADIKIAVNCYTPYAAAYAQYHFELQYEENYCSPPVKRYYYKLIGKDYLCDGTFMAVCVGLYIWMCPPSHPPSCPPFCTMGGSGEECSPCSNPDFACHDYLGYTGYACGDGIHNMPCDGQTYDVRTEYMKTQGCCPINPYTGLPF